MSAYRNSCRGLAVGHKLSFHPKGLKNIFSSLNSPSYFKRQKDNFVGFYNIKTARCNVAPLHIALPNTSEGWGEGTTATQKGPKNFPALNRLSHTFLPKLKKENGNTFHLFSNPQEIHLKPTPRVTSLRKSPPKFAVLTTNSLEPTCCSHLHLS